VAEMAQLISLEDIRRQYMLAMREDKTEKGAREKEKERERERERERESDRDKALPLLPKTKKKGIGKL